MFSTGAFNPTPMAFQFPGQQPQPSIYQSQFGGFNPQILPSFQQAQPRGQSLPALGRQYPPQPSSGHYAPGPASSSRRQHGQQYPPSQRRSSHHTKKHHKQRSFSPSDATDQGLYSDKEHRQTLEDENIRKNSDDLSRSELSVDEIGNKDQQSQGIETASGDGSLGNTLGEEDERIHGEKEKHKSSSKKKKHYRHDHYETCNNPIQQQTGCYGNFQNELPPHMKVHRQPLYNGYNQAYEESVRRGDVYQKQSKRSSRLPPEVKKQLLPHEGEQQQQQFPFNSPQGYPQQPFGGGVLPPFNPYQAYGPQPGFYPSIPAQPQAPFNTLSPWSHAGMMINPADQEIQRLRSHIHTLENELHKLQKKLTKATLDNNNEPSGHDENTRSHRRSKREGIGSPRQTPVIVELNSTTGEAIRESSSKKHRHRTGSTTSSQQGQKLPPQDSTSIQRSVKVNGENSTGQDVKSSVVNTHNQQQIDSNERSRANGNQITEPEDRQGKPSLPKNPLEETAANGRQAPNSTFQQQQQAQVPPPPPIPRQQIPNQQQQQQYLYQQGALPPQMRGPAPRFPVGGNIRYPGDQQQQQRNIANPNYNQSNNNELFDDNIERRKQDEQNRSAEKILDAFERSYLNRGRSSAVPMKVKYIPEEMNSNPKRSDHRQRNTNNNNNNRYRSTSRSSNSSSTWSTSDRVSSRRFNPKTTTVFTGPFM